MSVASKQQVEEAIRKVKQRVDTCPPEQYIEFSKILLALEEELEAKNSKEPQK